MRSQRYKLHISELQRRLILRALTTTIASDRMRLAASDALDQSYRAEWMALVRLFSQLDEPEAVQKNADA